MTSSDAISRRRTRWWPAVALLAAAAVSVVLIQRAGEADHQRANVRSAAAAAIGVGLAGAWLLLFAGLPRRARWALLAAGLGAPVLLLAGFRLHGVTGDLVPVLEWRFGAARPDPSPTPEAGAPVELPPGAADYPQLFGPGRDGVLAGPALARDWDARPPELLWRRPVGAGWSGFAVAGGRAVTQEQHGDDEAVTCCDLSTGALLWMHRYPARYFNTVAGLGPRATPTLDGGDVFAMGATGILHCLELATGRVRWHVNVLADYGAGQPEYGMAGSPLVTSDLVVVCAGGEGHALAAYRRRDGAAVWSAGSDGASYSSPELLTLAGVPQIVVFDARAVVAHDPASGRVLWRHPWKADHPHVCLPVALDGSSLLVSSGYGTGSQRVRIERDAEGVWRAATVWRSLALKAKFTDVVARGGHAFGLDDGTLACLDLADGHRRWKRGRYGHGQLILVDDLLLITTETGDVVLVEASPDDPRELARLAVFDTKTWNPPALAGRYLLVRNDREAACYRLPVR